MTPAFTLNQLGKRAAPSPVYPLALPEACLRHTFNGSAALYQAAVLAGLNEDDAVLLPAYCCGAELGPFQHMGCELLFYDVRADLSVNTEQIKHIINERGDIKLLLVTHYLGLPQPQIAECAQYCEEREILLLEDCAHALYCQLDGVPLGRFGDYAIFSPRKSLPMTEGGIVCSRHDMQASDALEARPLSRMAWLDRLCYSAQLGLRSSDSTRLGYFFTKLMIALWAVPAVFTKLVKTTSVLPANTWLTPDVEGVDAAPVFLVTPSSLSLKILQSSDRDDIVASRRANYALWVDCVAECEQIQVLNATWPEQCSPLYFVVQVSDPAKCVAQLAQSDIEAFNWWQHMSDVIDWNAYPEAKRLKKSLLALPVHQALTPQQIQLMSLRLKQIVRN